MPNPLTYFIIGTIAVAAFAVFGFFVFRAEGGSKHKSGAGKSNAQIRSAIRRLGQNPRDPDALQTLADAYYEQADYKKAQTHAKALVRLAATNSEIDEFQVTLRYALCALKLDDHEEAYKSLMIARTINQDDVEVNYNLGVLEYLQEHYEKATAYLKQVRIAQPDNTPVLKYLGHSLARSSQYQEAASVLRQVVELERDDKESLYALAQCLQELGGNENALRIFSHLRPDPQYGPQASLRAGMINAGAKRHRKAIEDYQIGLKHENIEKDLLLELKYHLAAAHFAEHELENALAVWNEIQTVDAAYKDVKELLARNQEVSANRNLQVYLMGMRNEFLALCRKLATNYYPRSHTKVVNVAITSNEYVDILTEVSTNQSEEIALFRFVRSSGSIGELLLRDLYATLKEVRAGRGICIAAGSFSEGAEHYVEARLIDLVDKQGLLKLLGK